MDIDVKKIAESANVFSNLLKTGLTTSGGLHAETIVASAGRMAGTMLFRGFPFDTTAALPGTVFISDAANESGPKFVNLMIAVLQQLGHQLSEQSIIRAGVVTTDLSHLSLLDTQRVFEPVYQEHVKRTLMSYKDAASAATMAAAMIIHDCRTVLDVTRSASLAGYGIVEGAKTIPYRAS